MVGVEQLSTYEGPAAAFQLPTNLICVAELGGNLPRDVEPRADACTWHRRQLTTLVRQQIARQCEMSLHV